MIKKAEPTETQSKEYKNMVDLLAVYSEASNQMAELEAELNGEMLTQMDERRGDYAKLQDTLSRTEQALEIIALAHPEWFGKKKSIQTPYGAVKFSLSSKLEVPNEEVSILLIEKEAEANREFKLATYVVQTKALSREALEKLDDATLAKFRIKRIAHQNFKVEPAKVDMGKAVKEAAESRAS